MTSFISFARRQNNDHSIDSICTKCYETVASADNVKDLKVFEEAHLCDPDEEFSQSPIYVSVEKGT